MDEETFRLFESFDFENNHNFQDGWRSIEDLIDPEQREFEYQRAQAFFFTKNVKTLDYQEYLAWKNRKLLLQMAKDINFENPNLLNHDAEDGGQEEKSLSLAEVTELIKNNQPIPGVVTIDVKPSNAEPTPSTISRKLKPWEQNKPVALETESQQSELSNIITY